MIDQKLKILVRNLSEFDIEIMSNNLFIWMYVYMFE